MPIELNDLILKRERTLAIPINGEGDTLEIRWNPSHMTPKVYAALQEWQGDTTKANPFDVATYLICPLLTWWDITAGGKMHPITPENVSELGLDFVVLVGTALNADYQLAADAKKDSAAA